MSRSIPNIVHIADEDIARYAPMLKQLEPILISEADKYFKDIKPFVAEVETRITAYMDKIWDKYKYMETILIILAILIVITFILVVFLAIKQFYASKMSMRLMR